MPTVKIPFIIDVEASGFGSASYPIEIGVILDNNRKFCTLIEPPQDWTHWDKQAEQVHHISRDTLKLHGKQIDAVADILNEKFKGLTLYSDGWVVDKPWLSLLFNTARKTMKFSVSPLEMILSEPQMAIWHQTKEQVIAEMDMPRHRASNDAAIIQQTFIRTLRQISGN